MPQETTSAAGQSPAATALHPPEFWTNLQVNDDDDSALGEDTESSTASISSSILHYRTLNGRTYHSDRGSSVYWGANDDKQLNTLDIAHHGFTKMTWDKLYLAPLPEHMEASKVLDIGTGTGLWAIDFADEHPEPDIIGTDLSPSQPTWVPPNVKFEIEDFADPWTFAENSFDYVHARWLIGAVKDWDALFANAYRVLKPGGYLESLDFDADAKADDGSITPDMALSQWGALFQEGTRKAGLGVSFNPVKEGLIRNAMKNAGFVNIEEKPVKLPFSEWSKDPRQRDVGLYARAALQNDIEGMISYPATHLGWTKDEIYVYAAHVRRELRGLKVHAYNNGAVIWGQKPLGS